MSHADNHRHQQTLRKIFAETSSALERDVAGVILDAAEDRIEQYMHDVSHHGCTSGAVGSLIYTADCHEFFDRHYDEIERLREEYQDYVGQPVCIRGDLKTQLAWFAFEECLRLLSYKLDMDL